MISLPDVNVLLALAWAQHHHAAHAWFGRAAADGWASCFLTQSAFLRLSMNPQEVQVALDCQTACKVLGGLVAHPNHQFVPDAAALTSSEFDPNAAMIRGYRQMTDATLLFQARLHGMKLVTFDQAATAICPWPENVQILVA